MEVEEPKVNLYRKIVLKHSARPSIEVSLAQENESVDFNSKINSYENDNKVTLEVEQSKSQVSQAQNGSKTDSNQEKSQENRNNNSGDKKAVSNGRHKKKRKSSRSRSRTRKKSRSRSRSRSRNKKHKKSLDDKHKKHKKKESKKRSRSSESHHRKSKKSRASLVENIIQDKSMEKIIDKKRLLALAKNERHDKKDPNFVNIFQAPTIPQPKLIFNRPIEKSIDTFVEFCKNLAKDNSNENEVNYLNNLQNEIETVKKENALFSRQQIFTFDLDINKKVNDVITKLFPVSSGTQHRVVEEPTDKIDNNIYTTSDQQNIITNQIITIEDSNRIIPEESQEIKNINLGKYTGVSDANFLKPEELEGEYKAWTRKDLLKTAAPITSGIGKKLLEKMGWKVGEGLGKNREGPVEPIKLDVKLNRKGLEADGVVKERTQKQIEGKHPVSCLLELCRARKWLDPLYETVEESGPSHQRNFLIRVSLNGVSYQPSAPSPNKKLAKAMAAYVCLQAFGIQSVIPT